MDNYLKKCAEWNAKRTLCKASLFAVPPEFLSPSTVDEASLGEEAPREETVRAAAPSARGLTCRACGCVFADAEQQQGHFKSELHGYNLRRKLRGLTVLSAEKFAKSGGSEGANDGNDGDSSSSDEEEDDEEAEQAQWNLAEYSGDDDGGETASTAVASTSCAFGAVEVRPYDAKQGVSVTFHPAASPWSFTVNQLALLAAGPAPSLSSSAAESLWRRLRAASQPARHTQWCVLLLRSGKFAGLIVDCKSGKVVAHKVFRRYTVRAKAGGSQSSHDNKGMKAQSAGATMRRAGELHLREDVEGLLRVWAQQLEQCSAILVSVPRVMRSYLFNTGDGGATNEALLNPRSDARIRSIPFMVAKVTHEECLSVYHKCSAVWFARRDLAQAAVGANLPPAASASASAPPLPPPRASGEGEGEENGGGDALTRALRESFEETELLLGQQRRARQEEKRRRRDARKQRSAPGAGEGGGSCGSEAEAEAEAERAVIARLAALMRSGRSRIVAAFLSRFCKGQGPREAGNKDDEEDEDEAEDEEERRLSATDSADLVSLLADSAGAVLEVLLVTAEPAAGRGHEYSSATLLHVAAETGSCDVVRALLLAGASPGLLDGRGRTSYPLCKDKETRDAFRRARAALEAGADDTQRWDAAGVGPALHPDKEALALAAQKEKEREKKRRAKERKHEKERQAKETAKQVLLQQEQLAAQMAEEARLRRAALGACAFVGCARPLGDPGVTLLEVFGGRVCSAACAIKFKRQVQAEAAEKRFGAGK